jgi:hypothetical protein
MSKDGSVIAVQLGGVTQVWYVESGRTQTLPHLETAIPKNLEISNDGKLILLLFENRLILWDLEQNLECQSIDPSGHDIVCASFTDDGKIRCECFGEEKGSLKIVHWDVANQHAPYVVPGPTHLSLVREWVKCDHRDLLWLPTYYRPSTYDKARNTIVLVCQDGRVVTMKIVDPDGSSTSASTALDRS